MNQVLVLEGKMSRMITTARLRRRGKNRLRAHLHLIQLVPVVYKRAMMLPTVPPPGWEVKESGLGRRKGY